jgi:hypothetical protein
MNRLRLYSIELVLGLILLGSVGFFAYLGSGLLQSSTSTQEFSGERALEGAAKQLEFGPRITGTPNNIQMGDWLAQELAKLSWTVLIEPFPISPTLQGRNIIAIRKHERANAPVAIVATHYDTRLVADADGNQANRSLPTPGANSGAAGAAVLLELARTLDANASQYTICLVLFDAEDNRDLAGWPPNAGSRYFVEHLADSTPDCVASNFALVLDMVGNDQQKIFIEQTGDGALSAALWKAAGALGYADRFTNDSRWSPTNAHTVFLEAGLRSTLLADGAYPHRHTLEDTLDKLSAESLQAVGRTIEVWLEGGAVIQ